MAGSEQTPSLFSTLRELGPWVLSIIALVQVWVIAVWNRIRHGSVEIYESGHIQVGYGGLGPSVRLTGTLRGVRHDVFVKRLEAVVVRKRDGARCEMGWAANQSATAGATEPVRCFLIRTEAPVPYDIILAEESFVSAMQPKLENLFRRWMEVTSALGGLAVLAVIPGRIEEVFGKFLQDELPHDLWTELNHRMYWEAGNYSLRFTVESSEGRKFSKEWSFRLREEDSKNLRGNTIAALRVAAKMESQFASAYPSYEDPS